MQPDKDSSPGITQPASGREAGDGPGRHRVRGWRPRTTVAKVSIAAGAAAGATGVALALVAGPSGAATKPVWIMTAGNVQTLSQTDPGTASYFFNTPASYGVGASLVKTPVQAGYRHAGAVVFVLRPVRLRHPAAAPSPTPTSG